MLWCGVHHLSFVPVSLLALQVPVSALFEICALPQLDFPLGEELTQSTSYAVQSIGLPPSD
jgi:hypothetical protein